MNMTQLYFRFEVESMHRECNCYSKIKGGGIYSIRAFFLYMQFESALNFVAQHLEQTVQNPVAVLPDAVVVVLVCHPGSAISDRIRCILRI